MDEIKLTLRPLGELKDGSFFLILCGNEKSLLCPNVYKKLKNRKNARRIKTTKVLRNAGENRSFDKDTKVFGLFMET